MRYSQATTGTSLRKLKVLSSDTGGGSTLAIALLLSASPVPEATDDTTCASIKEASGEALSHSPRQRWGPSSRDGQCLVWSEGADRQEGHQWRG
jgi:hypothetical protein